MIFEERPADFNPVFEAVGCFLQCQGEILLLLRQGHKKSGNTWGLPSGKVDDADQSNHLAMKREIFEETGLAIPLDDIIFFQTIFVRNDGVDFVYHIYFCLLKERPEVKITPKEHKGFQWIDPELAKKLVLIHDLDNCIDLFYFSN
ncbi:MAG: NUDIX hydrolase [Candidatus Parcubacteria bacterium]|nr:NUDIX hydrolase [Candidatus Parcubacteria bacterium]